MDNTFKCFSKKHWYLYLIFALVLIIPITILCWVFKEESIEFSGWASLVSGIFTYFGAVVLGVFVYYKTWENYIRIEFAERPEFHVDADFDSNEEGGLSAFSEKKVSEMGACEAYTVPIISGKDKIQCNYLLFQITNDNPYVPFKAKCEKIFYASKKERRITPCDYARIYTDITRHDYVEYKNKMDLYIGLPEEIIPEKLVPGKEGTIIFVVFKVANAKGYVSYYVHESTILNGGIAINYKHITPKEAKKINGGDYSVMVQSYNRKFFKF